MKGISKQLKYDLRMGIIKRWKIHMILAISFLMICSILAANHVGAAQSVGRDITGIDVLAYLMKGQRVLKREAQVNFNMPFYWLFSKYNFLSQERF